MPFKSTHVAADGKILFFLWLSSIPVCVCTRAYMYVCIYTPSSSAGSYGSSIFSFLRSLPTVFHSGCSSLHSCQQCIRIPFPPHPCRHLSLMFFFLITILWGGVSLCFWFLFPVMLSIFSSACWPFAFPLWKITYSILLPIFYNILFNENTNFLKKFILLSIVDLQCCFNFCCTAKWFIIQKHTHICTYSYSFPLWFITRC